MLSARLIQLMLRTVVPLRILPVLRRHGGGDSWADVSGDFKGDQTFQTETKTEPNYRYRDRY